jgi:predicted deacylase
MRVRTVGAGDPDVVVAGAVHGDEPCGALAIERFLEEGPVDRVQRPVKLVVVNEPALERGQRYVDTDLNRALPGDPTAEAYDRRLAHDFFEEVVGCTGLGIHSTVSYDRPFGALSNPDATKRATFGAMGPVEHVMDSTAVSNGRRCVDLPWCVDIEAGEQGTDEAATYAYDCMLDFLRHTGVLPGDPEPTETAFYEVFDTVSKEPGAEYRVRCENFRRVAEGETYATRDGEPLVAERPFWPVLMSATGHESLLGYRATRQEG